MQMSPCLLNFVLNFFRSALLRVIYVQNSPNPFFHHPCYYITSFSQQHTHTYTHFVHTSCLYTKRPKITHKHRKTHILPRKFFDKFLCFVRRELWGCILFSCRWFLGARRRAKSYPALLRGYAGSRYKRQNKGRCFTLSTSYCCTLSARR